MYPFYLYGLFAPTTNLEDDQLCYVNRMATALLIALIDAVTQVWMYQQEFMVRELLSSGYK